MSCKEVNKATSCLSPYSPEESHDQYLEQNLVRRLVRKPFKHRIKHFGETVPVGELRAP